MQTCAAAMRCRTLGIMLRRLPTSLLLWLLLLSNSLLSASTYNGRPKLLVVVIIDQFRGDFLERYRDQFGPDGFRIFLERGANFTDCNYDYANTRTAPGHATLLTGAYSNGHGIAANSWWDSAAKGSVTSVFDAGTKIISNTGSQGSGASPRNLLASTLGDELKLSTHGHSRVFAIALKDRAAVLPGGRAADGAYWMEHKSGEWISSTYYYAELPAWVKTFNQAKHAEQYWNRQ